MRFAFLALICTVVFACGQAGPLYLPQDAPAVAFDDPIVTGEAEALAEPPSFELEDDSVADANGEAGGLVDDEDSDGAVPEAE